MIKKIFNILWKETVSIEYSARQIQHYYEINLKPDLRKTDWNIEEDLLLIKLI